MDSKTAEEFKQQAALYAGLSEEEIEDIAEGKAVVVPKEPTEDMLKAAFARMNATPSGTWKRLKAENLTPRDLFDSKMNPRYAAMIAASPYTNKKGNNHA